MNLRKCRRDDTQTGTVISRSARRGSEALLFVGFYSQMALSLNGSLITALSVTPSPHCLCTDTVQLSRDIRLDNDGIIYGPKRTGLQPNEFFSYTLRLRAGG